MVGILSAMTEIKSHMATLNETMPKRQIAEHQQNFMEINRQVQRMERGGARAEDIYFEEPYPSEAEQTLEEEEKRLDKLKTEI